MLKSLENTLLIHGHIIDYIFLFRLPDAFYCLLGVIPYLYIKTYFNKSQRLPRYGLIHLMWPMLFLALEFMLFEQDTLTRLDLYYVGVSDTTLRYIVLVQAILALIYNYFTYKVILRYQSMAVEHFSNLNSLKLSQMLIANTILSIYFLFTIVILLFFFGTIHPMQYSFYSNLLFLLGSIVVFLIGSLGLRPKISMTEIEEFELEAKPQATKKIAVDPERMTAQHDRIINTIREEKLYLDPELKLSDVSDKTRTPSYLLSQIINTYSKKSFNDLINDYRIDEFKKLVKKEENQNITILALSLESGFNSKSNFNNQFKRRMKMTPTEYRDQLLSRG